MESKKSKGYVKKGHKNYQKLIDAHKDEILNVESKKRTDYVHDHLNNDLNLSKTKYKIYQLLYRNKLIDKKVKIDSSSSSSENNLNILMTISDITSQLSSLTKSDYNPEFIQTTIKQYINIMNKINEDFEELIKFKNELKTFI